MGLPSSQWPSSAVSATGTGRWTQWSARHTGHMSDNSDGTVRGRVWRDGQVVAEDFHFEKISDYLEDNDGLTWVDLCDPDHHRLQEFGS